MYAIFGASATWKRLTTALRHYSCRLPKFKLPKYTFKLRQFKLRHYSYSFRMPMFKLTKFKLNSMLPLNTCFFTFVYLPFFSLQFFLLWNINRNDQNSYLRITSNSRKAKHLKTIFNVEVILRLLFLIQLHVNEAIDNN